MPRGAPSHHSHNKQRQEVHAQLLSPSFRMQVAPKPGGCRVQARRTFKALFRRLCAAEAARVRALPVPAPPPSKRRHALLMEFRALPHVEVVLRHAMRQLGPTWAHTIVCGPDNESCMRALAPPGVDVLCLPRCRNMTLAAYNRLLTSVAFWQAIEGENILIHQEDSFMFKADNLERFLSYDYVGAPWHNGQVGNGGFSLRKRSAMLRLCRAHPPVHVPEDLHFHRLFRLHKSHVAPWSVARQFAVENVAFNDAVAGHQWWWAYRTSDTWARMVWESLSQSEQITPT